MLQSKGDQQYYWPLLTPLPSFLHALSILPQDAGSQQIGFLLGSCGVTVALTSDACHKGLPKSPTGEIPQFKGHCTTYIMIPMGLMPQLKGHIALHTQQEHHWGDPPVQWSHCVTYTQEHHGGGPPVQRSHYIAKHSIT